MDTPISTLCEQSLELLQRGDAPAAFNALVPAFTWPRQLPPDGFRQALETWARAGGKLKKLPFAAELKEAARRPDDGKLLFNLGAALLEEELHALAATFLMRAYEKRRSHEETISELVVALEGLRANAEALRVLKDADPDVVEDSFVLQYLLAFHHFLCRDVEAARALLPTLLKEKDEEYAELAGQLSEMITRADAAKSASALDEKDLRGWHFVMTGGILLHHAPTDDRRYAATEDTAARMREGIMRLQVALDAMSLSFPAIIAAPDEASAVLAQAAAEILKLPLKTLPPQGTVEPGLIVVYDLTLLDEKLADVLQWHRPGQALFVHAAPGNVEPPFVADFTTYLYSSNTPPSVTARAVVDASVPAPSDAADLQKLSAAAASLKGPAAAGAMLTSGQRRRQRVDSPV